MPLDQNGIPTLTADLTETQSIRDTLHNVDRVLVDNRDVMKDALLGFETYTASLAGKGDEIESLLRKADTAFDALRQHASPKSTASCRALPTARTANCIRN